MLQSKTTDTQFVRPSDVRHDGAFLYIGSMQVQTRFVSSVNAYSTHTPTLSLYVVLALGGVVLLLLAPLAWKVASLLLLGLGAMGLHYEWPRRNRISFNVIGDKHYEIYSLTEAEAQQILAWLRSP